MNNTKLLCLVSAVALATSAAAQSPASLVALAKEEKQRRAKLLSAGGPAKVYTETDRPGATETTTTEATPPGKGDVAAAAPGAKKKEKTPEEMAADKQKEWNDKVKQVQDQIKDLQGVIAKNERTLSSMYNITPARADLANSIEADKKKLADLQQSLVSLEDERRRAGMPRG